MDLVKRKAVKDEPLLASESAKVQAVLDDGSPAKPLAKPKWHSDDGIVGVWSDD
ncbi:MAG TPA: hypothetical protein VI997_02485 [Candidatus Thermoplasmatota archaeon]|nr:hypothetical protein [Candidatus Thermoplasmatota archaeon]